MTLSCGKGAFSPVIFRGRCQADSRRDDHVLGNLVGSSELEKGDVGMRWMPRRAATRPPVVPLSCHAIISPCNAFGHGRILRRPVCSQWISPQCRKNARPRTKYWRINTAYIALTESVSE